MTRMAYYWHLTKKGVDKNQKLLIRFITKDAYLAVFRGLMNVINNFRIAYAIIFFV